MTVSLRNIKLNTFNKEAEIINVKINHDFDLFINRARHAKIDLAITNDDIADKTGLSKKTIEAFFCETGRKTERTAELIAKALKIER